MRNLLLFCWFIFGVIGIEKSFANPNPLVFRPGKDIALFFANDDYSTYPNFDDLKNPVWDAKTLAKELEEMFAFEVHLYLNLDRQAIYEALDEWQDHNFAQDGQLFIFFSGHGTFDEITNKGYFIPSNANPAMEGYIDLTSMGNIISNIPCPHILLAIDACYSGTIDREIAFKGKIGKRPGAEANSKQRLIERQLNSKSRLLITSGGKQRTPDGEDHSPFSNAILKGLRSSYVSGDNLFLYTDLLGRLERVNPLPHEGTLNGHEDGGFIFVVSDSVNSSTIVTEREPSSSDETHRIKNHEPYAMDQTALPQQPELEVSPPEGNSIIDKAGREISIMEMNDGRIWSTQNMNISVEAGKCFKENLKNCDKYGRMYYWKSANEVCKYLGEGWVLPTLKEWKTMLLAHGGYYDYQKLEYKGDPTRALDNLKYESGFGIKLGGLVTEGFMGREKFIQQNKKTSFWTRSIEAQSGLPWHVQINAKEERKIALDTSSMGNLRYVRCIWDPVAASK